MQEISSLDLKFITTELRKNLINGIIRKIYQYKPLKDFARYQLLFEIFTPQKGPFWLYADSNKIFITQYKKVAPTIPLNFCMFLRKYLIGRKIRDIKQHEFDRIIEFSTDNNVLIFEFIYPGNVVLCDSSYNTIMPLEIQRFRDRLVLPKKPYYYPPSRVNPFALSLEDFQNLVKKSDSKIIVFLANLGFGSIYGKEICSRVRINENKITLDLNLQEVLAVHKVIEFLDKIKLNPTIYADLATPFQVEIYKGKEVKQTGSFCQALDEFWVKQEIEVVKEEKEKKIEEQKAKVARILTQQEKAILKWEDIEKEDREKAETIYNYYSLVESVLNGIRKARNKGMAWEEIKSRIEEEDTQEADAIKEIREGEGIVMVNLGGKEIELDFRKSVEENAEHYYVDAKWAKKKFVGAAKAVERQKLKKPEIPQIITEPKIMPKKRKRWYEKFRWFVSSNGFLVVAGKDATTNNLLIKKYLETSDLVFHANIQGAGFVVIKSKAPRATKFASIKEREEMPDETKKEAAEFAATCSKAWSKGLGNIDIYSMRPEQISKTPPSGEYLPKGSFMISGSREWYRDKEVKLSVGVKVSKAKNRAEVVAGPVMSTRKHSDYFVTIQPGLKQSLELAKDIKNNWLIKAKPEDKNLIEKIPLEDIQKVIPAGKGEIIG